MGHPLNAYHFVRHVAARWNDIHNEVLGNNSVSEDVKILAEREKEKLPDLYDVQGGGVYRWRVKNGFSSGIHQSGLSASHLQKNI